MAICPDITTPMLTQDIYDTIPLDLLESVQTFINVNVLSSPATRHINSV